METKTATVKQVQGVTLIGKSGSNHWVTMDSVEKVGGSNAASTPKELVLMALGGCTAMDVISILEKQRVSYDHIEIRLTATERDEHPRIYTAIHIEFVIHGNNIDTSMVERAIELSTTKYCSVSAMLKPTVNITHSYCIEPVAVS
jgi:putative redox protein